MKKPPAMDEMRLLLKRYFFLFGIALSLLLTLACCHDWTAHRAFSPDGFTLRHDPSMNFLVESCHITRNTLSVSGWVMSDVWPGNGASLILTAGNGTKEFSIPYRLRERSDIARTFHTEGNAFHNRYGFTGIVRTHGDIAPAETLHLNIISGHTLYRTAHACRP